jgi:phage tail sheath protein FI
MPVQVAYPGVYIEERPSGPRAIVGVSTSVAAMVGYVARGPVNTPVQIFKFGDFQRVFGGLDPNSELSYGVSQFFLNGGGIAWITRVASQTTALPLATAGVTVATASSGTDGSSASVLTIAAANAGSWGNNIYVSIDYDTSDPTNLFNISATEYRSRDGGLMEANTTTARDVTMDRSQPNYAPLVVANIANTIINLTDLNTGSTVAFPAPTGAVGLPRSPMHLQPPCRVRR